MSAGQNPSVLSVLFGNTNAFPNEGVVIGTTVETQHLGAGKLTWFFGDPSDSIASYVAMAHDATNAIVVVPIQGHTDRQLTSPLILSKSQVIGRAAPVTGAVGRVSVDAGLVLGVDMLAGPPGADASTVPLTLWTAPTSGTSSLFDPGAIIFFPPTPTRAVW